MQLRSKIYKQPKYVVGIYFCLLDSLSSLRPLNTFSNSL